MTGLLKRLRMLIQPEKRGAAVAFSRKTGISYARIRGWLYRGDLKYLPEEEVEKVCQAYGLSPIWLVSGVGDKFALSPGAAPGSVPGAVQTARRVPIVSYAQARQDGFWEPFSAPSFSIDGLETVETFFRDIGAYAMRIEGESMAPLLRPGDLIVVSPNKPVSNGDIVVLKTADDEVMVRTWRLNGDIVLLKSCNRMEDDLTFHLRNIAFHQKIIGIEKR